MKAKSRQFGITLTEMTVVIAVVALLGSLGLPAVRMLFNSFESHSGGRAVISAALATARAIAAKEQRYAGVRFQKAYDPDGPLKAPQYMIFIVHDFDKTGLVNGFRAVEGLEPIKLPDSVGVMDLRHRTNLNPRFSGDVPIDDDNKIAVNMPENLTDTTTFSIIFSPSGKLVIHDVRVRNRDGQGDSPSYGDSFDDIFNKKAEVDVGIAMFYQDDYAELGLGQESSRNSFIIYEEEKFRQAYKGGRAWSDYLVKLAPEAIYINPYTGTMIER